MMALIFEYRFVIAIVVAILLYAVFAWSSFKTTIYALMLQAKSLAKDLVLKSGQEQEDWVVMKIYQFAPKYITVFISNDNMRKIVKLLFLKGKDYLDNGKLDNSFQDEK